MALIKCPDCGREVSDKSKQCIHCGCPIEQENKIFHYNGKSFDLSQYKQMIDDGRREDAWPKLGEEIGNVVVARAVCHEISETGRIPAEWGARRLFESDPSTPHCPRCGSTSITASARGVNFTWGLIGASKTVNRCMNCGHTWKPKG